MSKEIAMSRILYSSELGEKTARVIGKFYKLDSIIMRTIDKDDQLGYKKWMGKYPNRWLRDYYKNLFKKMKL